MSGAKPRYENVDGAPVKIGQQVTVANPTDETGYPEMAGKTGTVVYLEYNCGCGQSFPHDPMVGVEFPDGQTLEFWKEELT